MIIFQSLLNRLLPLHYIDVVNTVYNQIILTAMFAWSLLTYKDRCDWRGFEAADGGLERVLDVRVEAL